VSGMTYEDGDFKVEIEQEFVNEPVVQVQEQVAAVASEPEKPVIKVEPKYFKSDRVGIFYLNEQIEAPKYVKEGQKVKKGDTICIIKAMKIKNKIQADQDFTIKAVMAEEDKPVEYGQPLFEIG
jgi:acetyl-CoA carboxylase biotin carboxyl carrier protein